MQAHPRGVRRWASWWWTWIDSESVRPFQAIIYGWVLVAGLYMALVGGLPQAVESELGHGFNAFWVTCCISGPLLTWLGYNMRADSSRRVINAWSGMWVELFGDSLVVLAFATYVVAVLSGATWGKGIFGVFVFVGLTMCAFILVVRDFRRITFVDRVHTAGGAIP